LELLSSSAVDGIGTAAATKDDDDDYNVGLIVINGQNNALL
jgi:hypothetical protein